MHICATFSRLWWFANFASYRCCIIIILIGSVWMSFLRISFLLTLISVFIPADISCVWLSSQIYAVPCIFAGVSSQERQPTCLSWLRHILFITAELAIKYYSFYPIRRCYFSINIKWSLNYFYPSLYYSAAVV